eukprot:7410247-Pyramimonas_sp.AAC.1
MLILHVLRGGARPTRTHSITISQHISPGRRGQKAPATTHAPWDSSARASPTGGRRPRGISMLGRRR